MASMLSKDLFCDRSTWVIGKLLPQVAGPWLVICWKEQIAEQAFAKLSPLIYWLVRLSSTDFGKHRKVLPLC